MTNEAHHQETKELRSSLFSLSTDNF